MRTWFTVMQAAEYAGVSRDTIYTACERREIRQVRVGGRRAIRLKPDWIDAWLERHVLDAHDRRVVGRESLSVDVQSEATS
jgi:excisionase family DNA binding protein